MLFILHDFPTNQFPSETMQASFSMMDGLAAFDASAQVSSPGGDSSTSSETCQSSLCSSTYQTPLQLPSHTCRWVIYCETIAKISNFFNFDFNFEKIFVFHTVWANSALKYISNIRKLMVMMISYNSVSHLNAANSNLKLGLNLTFHIMIIVHVKDNKICPPIWQD